MQKFPSLQTADVRLVNVRVFGWENGRRTLLAEVSSVIQTIADRFPSTQVYDVYCLAIENVPGWWVYMSNLVPFVERAIVFSKPDVLVVIDRVRIHSGTTRPVQARFQVMNEDGLGTARTTATGCRWWSSSRGSSPARACGTCGSACSSSRSCSPSPRR